MAISVGARLPDAMFLQKGAEGIGPVALAPLLAGRRVILFGLPGAFTGTCSTMHVPSFIRTRAAFAAEGVDEIICVAVNDPFVMQAWEESTGAAAAGILSLADWDGAFTKAMGMEFTAPVIGLSGRSRRYSLLAEDGVVRFLNEEPPGGECEISAGETLLSQLQGAESSASIGRE